ncbi:MAG: imidazolonepropionase [Caldisericaceae bacterium]|nr:imidazolonepropionase [Caldisericaceae bacterium]
MEKPVADIAILNAGQLLTMKPIKNEEEEEDNPLGIIEDGAVAIKDGKIIAVGKTNDVIKQIEFGRNTIQIDANKKVVMPGFVDPHTHIIFKGTREREFVLRHQGVPYMKILKEENAGIISTVRWTRKATFDELLEITRTRISEMVDWGTTTLEIKSGYGLNLEEEIKILKIAKYFKDYSPLNIKSTLLAAHIIPPEYHMRDEKYVELVVNDIIPIIAENKLADFNDVWCEKGAFTREQSRKILKAGLKYGLIPKIHADEMSDAGGAKIAAEVKAISADHLVYASEEGLTKMKEANVTAVLLPITTFSLGKEKFADGKKMVEMGLTVALGTDYNPGTAMCPSMPLVISFAVVRLKMDVVSALYGATLNAAKAIGLDSEVGSLEVGKRANVNVLNIRNYEEIPYRIAENYVEKVISNGEILK